MNSVTFNQLKMYIDNYECVQEKSSFVILHYGNPRLKNEVYFSTLKRASIYLKLCCQIGVRNLYLLSGEGQILKQYNCSMEV